MHGLSELLGIAIIAITATLCGMAMVQFRQPPIIGYILSGILLGPGALGLVQDRSNVETLAEIGVILLLYFIGIELSLQSFRQIWKTAVGATIIQIVLSILFVLWLGPKFGLSLGQMLLFAFCLAVSSTAVSVTVVQSIGESSTRTGQLVIGILIAQDLAIAPMLLIISGFGGGAMPEFASLVKIAIEVAISIVVLVAFIVFLARKKSFNMPFADLVMTKSDLTPLAVLAWCLGFALISGLLGLSPAFGAFLAGLTIGNSAQSSIAHKNAEPIKVVLLMVFFLSIGLLVDLGFLFENFLAIMLILVSATVFKTLLNVLGLRALGKGWGEAFLASLLLGQMGEFSFVMGAVAVGVTLIDQNLLNYLISITVLSLITAPFYVSVARRLHTVMIEKSGEVGLGIALKTILRSLSPFAKVKLSQRDIRFLQKEWQKQKKDRKRWSETP